MTTDPNGGDDDAHHVPSPENAGNGHFEALLEYLRRTRGFDFTGYKRSSLMRRVGKRMAMVGVEGYEPYIDFLEVHPDEFAHLFDTILINVTSFFRDPSAWEALQAEIIPRILANKKPDEPIRAWSAGCASGEEAYTIAMVLAEVLGIDAARERVKVYATDADEKALTVARHATYDAKQVEGIPRELLGKYFEQVNGNRYGFHKELRRGVIFGRHDLIQDSPISRIDLLVCRNVLMYFNHETQARILDRFHFALNDRGFLFLGKAETLLSYNHTFEAVDLKRRIFTKVARGGRERFLGLGRNHPLNDGGEADTILGQVRLREASFELATVAQLVVGFNGLLTLANERARQLFKLTPTDMGRPLQDLEISFRPVELRSCLERAYKDRLPVALREVEWRPGPDDLRYLDVHVMPLTDATGSLLGAAISFHEVTEVHQLRDDLQQSHRELETAYEELQSTNEELETTNEELQSTVEELETTNEELQSTNEELETMNEELQSTNEELETVNEEFRRRSEELNRVNTFLESILGSIRAGVIVLDADLRVLVWNPRAEDLWGLRAEEVRGKNLLSLDINLPVDGVRPVVRSVLAGEEPVGRVELRAVNRRGKPIRCNITCTPMRDAERMLGVTLLMEDEDAH